MSKFAATLKKRAHAWQNIQGFWLVFNLFLALGSVFLL